jgi:putative transposase
VLEYKTKWYGSKLVVAPKFYPSSRMCSGCGYVLPDIKLSTRYWVCPECGIYHDRDINAAQNLVNYLETA